MLVWILFRKYIKRFYEKWTIKSEISLNWAVYDFSVDYSSIEKEGILNIHEYLMIKNKVNYFSSLLKQCLLDY